MPGILPDPGSGGLVIRDAAGNCTPQPNVVNAYCPPAAFVTSCEVTALPSDCTARITAAQINAIVSELMSFAACLDPNGPWNCAATNNLCNAFNTWAINNTAAVIISDTAPIPPKVGTLWYESDTGRTHIWYDDGNTTQWVQIAPGSGGSGSGGGGTTPLDVYVEKAGDTMTGMLALSPTDPFDPFHAAHKQYVDQRVGVPAGGAVGEALVKNLTNTPEWGAAIDGGLY